MPIPKRMDLRRLGAIVLAPAAALASAAFVAGAASGTTGVAGTVAGTVFRDYSADGARGPLEPGEAGIVVTAYDAAGTAVGSATSAADGTYTLAVTGAATTALRLGFAIPVAEQGYLRAGALGADSAGAVQFAAIGDTGVDFGVENPAEYCQANPNLATTCMTYAHQQGPASAYGSVRSFPYAVTSAAPVANGPSVAGTPTPSQQVEATHGQVGTTFAVEWSRTRRTLYAAAFQKQYAGFGPGGPGAVYRTVGGVTSVLATIPNAGTDVRAGYSVNGAAGATMGDDWLSDPTWDSVGKLALGDMSLTDDEATLWVVNLADRKLYPVATATGAVGTPVAVPLATGAAVGCAAADVRPFALGRNDGTFYLGETCTGQSTQLASDLRFYVYAFDPVARTFSASPVFEAAIPETEHGLPGDHCNDDSGNWHPWSIVDQFQAGECGYPQPWLTSIAFDRGNLLLAVRDRFGDQAAVNYPYNSGTLEGVGAGDLLRACGRPATGWTLEANGSCGGVTTTGAGNGQGPGGGEYYWGDHFFDGTEIQETSNGGVAQVPGFPTVAYTATDPSLVGSTEWSSGGVHYDRNDTGANDHWVELYDRCDSTGAACPPGRNPTGTFGKANGLGDLVALCDAAPVEIGDRVWYDADADGVQDAGEPGLADVPVTLFAADGTTVLATTTTAGDGTYVFSSDPTRPASAGRVYQLAALTAGTQVIVAVPAARATSPHGALVLTTAATGAADVDSNADRSSGRSAPITIGAPGHHDHDIDFGYVNRPVGGVACSVYVDANRNGRRDAGEQALPGVTVQLIGPDGTVVATAVTDADGNCRFDGIPPGSYRLRQVQPEGFASTTPDDLPVDVAAGTVTNDPGFGEAPNSLPRTGGVSTAMAWAAATLVLLGGWFVWIDRPAARRRRALATIVRRSRDD